MAGGELSYGYPQNCGSPAASMLTVGQHGMTFEVHGRECRLCVVVGHEI
jgi:hypothetical protein